MRIKMETGEHEVKELKQSVKRLQTLMDEAPIVICNTDLKGKITYVNKRGEKATGYSREEVLGKNVLKLGIFSDETVKLLAKRMKDRLMGRPPRLQEMQLKCKDGHWIWIAMEGRLMRVEGIPVGFQIMAREIAERKRAEEALQAEKNKLQSVVDAMASGLSIQDMDYNIIYQNESMRIISGDHLGEKCYRAYEGKEGVCDGCPVEKAFRDGKPHTSERRGVTASGEVTFLENTANPIRDAGGRIVSCLEIVRDINERKQAEQALLESEERFRSIVENSQAGIMIMDDAYRFIYVNPQLCQMSGYSPNELIGQDFRQFLDEESRQLVADRYIRRQRGEEIPPRYEFNIVPKDGQKRRVEISSAIIKDSAGRVKTVAQILDITERKQAEEALKLQQAYFQQLFDNSPAAIAWLDAADRFVNVNEGFETLFGYRIEEIKGRFINELVIPEDRIEEASALSQAALNNKARRKDTVRKRKDGSLVDVDTFGYPIQFGNKTVGVYAVYTDITERKQAEEELRQAKEQFQALVQESPLGVSMIRKDGRYQYVNPKFVEMFGYTLEDVPTGREWFAKAYPDPEYRRQVISTWKTTVVEVSKRGESRRQTFTVTCKDGSEKVIYFRPVTLETGDHFVICEDITERKKAEEREKQLQQELYLSTRLASIGELAAGVAHEINNPLTGVLGFSQRLLRKSTSEEVSRGLEIIHSEAQRAAEVVQNLLTFARCRQPKKEYSNINDIVQKALELRAYVLQTSNIEVVANLAPGLPEIMVDFPQIQEVFLNIILNAEQAMSETYGRGKLVIKTREVKDYVRISFADDGPGIPPEQLDKVFDPFFTTREEKGGTGLGLSACHGIVTEHGGRIYVRSKPGKGATFIVELPLSLIETTVGRRA